MSRHRFPVGPDYPPGRSLDMIRSYKLLFLGLLISPGIPAAGIEMPAYVVEKKDENFEIRQYPEMVAAATASSDDASGFGRLFRFISGQNEADQKIAMTSPVFMPATVDGDLEEMMFLVPRKVVEAGVPQPRSEEVAIRTVPSGRFAVIRSAGRMDSKMRQSLLSQLRRKIEEYGLTAVGEPMYAGYDPPWTPAPKRRNEVMLRIQ